jgi:5-methylthioadenosine/S-adenosylhomocysteine deaminase
MPASPPIDPLEGPKQGLSGRVVTMDDDYTVVDKGVVWMEEGAVVAVQGANEPPPAGFEDVRPVATGGTIFPGLIELHNHLAYNALRLWRVPKLFTNRDQWGNVPDYRKLISGPMQVLGPSETLMPAVVRYVECKALVAGTTTSQGIELFSNAGARRYYRGIVRNVENTDDPALPEAEAKISDVVASSARRFLARLRQRQCFILHLSEGTDDAARSHFLALKLGRRWAITDSLAGIHCAALKAEDFKVMGTRHASMVWSPLSNLLLYGDTAHVKQARAAKLKIGLGSDWSPTGSKNLLGELKVAKLVSDEEDVFDDDRELVAMVTREAARILRWDQSLGTIEPPKRADLIVIDGNSGNPYDALLHADERSLRLVMIGGVPRFGLPGLLERLGAPGEEVTVGGRKRALNLKQETADPVVGALTFAEARDRLRDALANLKELRKQQEQQGVAGFGLFDGGPLRWALALDELRPTGMELRPRLRFRRRRTGPELAPPMEAAGPPLSEILEPLELDPLTVADDHDFLDTISAEPNLPTYLAPGLRSLYPS